MLYAEVIVDIVVQALDRIFTYSIPEELEESITVGAQVAIPFGKNNRERRGFVMRIKNTPDYEPERIKGITRVLCDSSLVEGQLLQLAYWIREQYGSTLVQALSVVLPIKAKINEKSKVYYSLAVEENDAEKLLAAYESKHYVAKVRLLRALLEDKTLTKNMAVHALHIPYSTINTMYSDGIIKELSTREYRNPTTSKTGILPVHRLNAEQQSITDIFCCDYSNHEYKTYLLYGVTGSGKTEVYLEMLEKVLEEGREAIVLIPEIALTYQTVRRFANRFGDLVTVVHSKLSKGERYDQFERAKKGEVKIMIGPRSALFAPFSNLGLIIIDEEHETSYKSESPPKYHARETAIRRAELANASVVLGSATPSVESFHRAMKGEYKLLSLKKRAAGAVLPTVEVVDMRNELAAGNFKMFSRTLQAAVKERLFKGEQSILFINRRGYASFVSCRKCGFVVKCSHCDVSLKLHGKTRLVCHYCGYEEKIPLKCPECGSGYIRSFGTGTEKVEEQLHMAFPEARVLRMDADTTKQKGGHEKLLAAFANEEADILVGTQMIVKGHDFPKVTLVAALAADMSLYEQNFRSGERTFDLLTQAAGRAGRGDKRGHMIIQCYRPEQYAIAAAARQDYEGFYQEEIAYRKLLRYPPVSHMLAVFMAADNKVQVEKDSESIAEIVKQYIRGMENEQRPECIGPGEASVYRVQDVYRRILYIKYDDYQELVRIKNIIEDYVKCDSFSKRTRVYFDFDPMNIY